MLQTYNYINFVHDNPEKIVLKQLFSYQHPEGISQNAELSIGLGKRLFSYIVMDTEKRIPVAILVDSFFFTNFDNYAFKIKSLLFPTRTAFFTN